ncbi:MAG: LysR family transcriptional regulator [Burkholderiales bacterium]|nr:LysR family transcriptional regulator [Burkholderiales bacterium]
MRYDLVDLKLFIAVADAGNVTRGAAACFLAPSSASLRIKQLEQHLGVRLFSRHAHGVELTRAGQVMIEHVRRCLAELQQMHADLAPYAHGIKSQITLFANSTAIASYLPDDLAAYFRRFPGVRVVLEERLSIDIVAAVAEGRADLGVVTWSGEHPQLAFAPYREDELVALVPHKARLGRGGKIGFAECLAHPFISLRSGAAIHTFLVGRAAALGHHLDVRVQVAAFSAVIALVRSGAGLAIVPRSVLRDQPLRGLDVLRLDEPWARRPLSVCARRDGAQLSAPVQALLELLTTPR